MIAMNMESITAIEKYCKSVESKLASYVDLHIRLTKLAGYSTCPLCESDLNRQDTAKLLLLVSEKLAQMRAEKANLDAKMAPEIARKNAERIEKENKERLARDLYIESHKSLFAKLLKQWRADQPNFTLPDIPVEERALWNRAVNFYAASSATRSDMECEIVEFEFEV